MITYDIIIEHLCTFNDIYQENPREIWTAHCNERNQTLRIDTKSLSLLAQNQMELLSIRIKTNAKLHTWLAGEAARAFACHPRCTGFCWNPCPSQVSLQDNLAIFGFLWLDILMVQVCLLFARNNLACFATLLYIMTYLYIIIYIQLYTSLYIYI